MARHRRDDEQFAAADPTVVLPAVTAAAEPSDEDAAPAGDADHADHAGYAEDFADEPATERRRGGRTVSPLLIGAGGVALTLIMVVGGWALAGGHGGGDPLVYPWSSDTPGPIDVSISLEPTVLPSPTVDPTASLSPSPATPRPTRSRSASPSLSASVSPSAESMTATTTAEVMSSQVWSDGFVVHYKITNKGSSAATWQVKIVFSKAVRLDSPWNATADTLSGAEMTFTAKQALAAGTSVDFGFVAYRTRGATLGLPATCTIDGKQFPCALS
ncbi:cellulose binding domain-containing protein [Hamadaea sp. NPDC051192]|uniref:cellulose binding domain-containing protein n=1 Tax=Hamadaea sp. NPDC051192 TaxID=3154940 RepID=UPI00344421FC